MQTDADRAYGQFSPDGKWIAYSSTESGRWEIYVQPFPGPGTKSLVSTAGGISARWGPDGKELLYIALDDQLMAVPIQLASDGQSAEARTPVPLFTTRVGGALRQTEWTPHYVVAPDGRFLMNTVVEDANASPITVILNWKAKS
jgi:Tol biopolymer transport system component